MKIALAQVNTTVGALTRNADLVIATLERAREAGADLVVFPELTITGYPPLDLLDRPSFVTHNLEQLHRAARATVDLPAAVVGFVDRGEGEETGKNLFNAAALCAKGEVVSVHRKTLLPTYDVFDEMRHFAPAESNEVTEFGGMRLAVSICEDIWNDARFWGRLGKRRYQEDPIEALARQGFDLLINISASPFAEGKRAVKKEMFAATARRHARPVVHVNLVGGNDSLVFEGWSCALNPQGEIVAQARDFGESLLVVDTDALTTQPAAAPAPEGMEKTASSEIEAVCEALTLGVRDYVGKCGFRTVVVGLSGGVDSAVTAALAARALGPENVLGVSMPSPFSSQHSRDDAEALARNLGVDYRSIPIETAYESLLATLAPAFEGRDFDLTEENLQARIRGTLLMALSNKFGHLVLSTGNKSEMAVGYCTLYGDMCGGLAVLSDVPKTMVYALAEFLNQERELVPRNTIEKPPSAELRPDQLDSDSLPPYDVLDAIIRAYVEEHLYVSEIAARGFPRETVETVIRMIENNEYKRQQAATGLKVTHRAFGYGRRIPMARGRDA